MNGMNYRLVKLNADIEVPYMAIDGNNELTPVYSFHAAGKQATIINGKLRFAVGDEIDLSQIAQDSYALVNDGKRVRPIFDNAPANFSTTPNFSIIPVRRGFDQIKDVYEKITPKGGFIGGGWATWMAVPDSVRENSVVLDTNHIRPKDADIFCYSQSSFNDIHSVLLDVLGFMVIGSNDIVRTYTPPRNLARKGCPVIQLIAPRKLANGTTFGHPEEVADSFDFSVSRSVLVSPTDVLADADMAKDYAAKRIVLRTAHCPIGNAMRVSKYSAKGFSADPYQYLVLAEFCLVHPQRILSLYDFAKRVSDTIAFEKWNDTPFPDRLDDAEKGLLYQMLYID